jgi:hypothetical protein
MRVKTDFNAKFLLALTYNKKTPQPGGGCEAKYHGLKGGKDEIIVLQLISC